MSSWKDHLPQYGERSDPLRKFPRGYPRLASLNDYSVYCDCFSGNLISVDCSVCCSGDFLTVVYCTVGCHGFCSGSEETIVVIEQVAHYPFLHSSPVH